MNFIWFLTSRYLNPGASGARTARLAATVALGIVLGTFLVFLSLGILSGAHSAYRQAILGFNAHVILYKEGPIDEIEQGQIADFISSTVRSGMPVHASPFLAIESLMPTRDGLKPVMLKGVDLKHVRDVYDLQWTRFPAEEYAAESVFLGSEIAEMQIGALSTKRFRLMSLQTKDGKADTRLHSLPIAGTFKSGIHDFDAGFVLADIKWLQKQYFADKRVTGYEIRLAAPENAEAFVTLFRARFGDAFLLLTWEQLNSDLLEILAHEESTIFAVAAMVILICCINIVGFAILFFVLHEREFGILSLLGCQLNRLRAVLSFISVAAGSVATLMGAGLSILAMRVMASGRGIPLDPEVYYLDHIPVEIQLQWMAGFVGLTIVLCFVASLAASLLILRRRVANMALV